MKTIYTQVRKFLFLLLTWIARILPDLKPYKTDLVLPAQSWAVTLPVNVKMLPTKFAKRFFAKKKIAERHILFFKNVFVNGDAVVFKNLRVYSPSLAWKPYIKWYKSGRFLVRQWLFKVIRIKTAEIVALAYNQFAYENYYHWIIESLPRLLLIQKVYPKAIIIIPGPTPEFIKSTIKILGFQNTVTLSTKDMIILKANKLALPSLEFEQAEEYVSDLADGKFSNPNERSLNSLSSKYRNQEELIITLRNRFLNHFKTISSGRKIFVSRSKQKNRRLINEKDLEPILTRYGFETVYFEEMSFNEQVKLMQETDVLFGIHGAGMVNILFLPATAIVIEMINEHFVNDMYYTMASSLKLPYYVVPCSMTDTSLIPPDDVIILNDTANFTDQMDRLNRADLQVNTLLLEDTLKLAFQNIEPTKTHVI